MKKIIVFGGAFNPPLNSHFSLAEQIVNEYENVEKIIFVPVNSKYQKSEALLSNEHRYNMLKLVCEQNENFEVSDIELKSDRPLYTIETLNILQKQYPNNEIVFTTGTDNLREFDTWHEAEQIVRNFKILVLERDEDNMDDIIALNPFLSANKSSFIKVKENIRSNLSSTFVRDKIRRGKSIRYLIPDEVYRYIKGNKLYEVM
ncbi:MAG: nicotinate (nicotinamide) nucleotide adenylyltransferase [Clostridia bacterium]|nr:nicotinate (nicotinamide) nucleotide adenylyltransferase [Clostridia bacterium]